MKIALSFALGTAVTAGAGFLADSRIGIMFLAGVMFAAVLLAAGLASVSRARAVARFIDGVCDSLESSRKSRRAAPEPQSAPLPGGARADQHVISDLQSALQNFGMNRKKAEAAAIAAASEGGTLPEMIRRATAHLSQRVN